MSKLIFISHKETERPLAETLVDFLTSALELSDAQIRCTSVPGHQLPFGKTIPEQLKQDIHDSAAVIVLVTQESLRSKWVLFELGASWSLSKMTIPILAPGLAVTDLPGPLSDYPYVQITADDSQSRLMDSIQQIASTVGIQQKSAGKAYAKLGEFVKQFSSWSPATIQLETDQASRVSIVRQLEEDISTIFKDKAARVPEDDSGDFHEREFRYVLDNHPRWQFVPDHDVPLVAGWPPPKSQVIDGQRHWLIRPNDENSPTCPQYIASQALQESLLWFRRVRRAHEAGVVIVADLADMWRFILPLGFAGRLYYYSRYFQGTEEVEAMIHVIAATLEGCYDLRMRKPLNYFLTYLTEEDRDILAQTDKKRKLLQKVTQLGS